MRLPRDISFHAVTTLVFVTTFSENVEPSRLRRKHTSNDGCTIFGQAVVDELHLIDSEGFTVVCFSLTLFGIGVKPTSFFDSFQRLPGWW
jgi:hypothetical protein